jgi:cytochrome P450
MLDGDRHRRSRGMMLPAFHGDSVRRQVAQMIAITAEDVARWPAWLDAVCKETLRTPGSR